MRRYIGLITLLIFIGALVGLRIWSTRTRGELEYFSSWDISYGSNVKGSKPQAFGIPRNKDGARVRGNFKSSTGEDLVVFTKPGSYPRPKEVIIKGDIKGVKYEEINASVKLSDVEGQKTLTFSADISILRDGSFIAKADMLKPDRINNILWFCISTHVSKVAFELRFVGANGPFDLTISQCEIVPALPDLTGYVPKKIQILSKTNPRVIIGVHNSADYYDLSEAVSQVSPNADMSIHKFRALNLPLDNWPQDLNDCDLVILGDVDTFVFTDEELKRLGDFVFSGGNLIIVAGSISVSQSRDPRGLFNKIIPVEVIDDSWIRSTGPILAGEHLLIGKGLDLSRFNGVGSLQNLKPKANSQVCLRSQEGPPVCIVGEYGDGKVVLLNGYPELDEDFGKRFFWSDEYHDLMKQIVEWTLGKREESSIAQLVLDEPKVELRSAKGEIDCRAHILIDDIDFIKEGKGATVAFDLIPEGMKDEVHDVKVDISVGSEKRTLTFQYYPYDWKPEILLPYSKRTFAYGFKVDLGVKVPDMPGALADNIKVVGNIYENDGTLILDELPFKRSEDRWEYTWDVPDLAEGEYALKVYLKDASGNILGQVSEGIAIVPEDREGPPFPITSMMAIIGEGQKHGPPKIEKVVWDLYSHGINTLFMPNIKATHMLAGPDNVLENPYGLKARHLAFSEMYGQLLGMGVLQRDAYVGVLTRSAPDFDIFAEDALAKTRELVDPFIDYVELIPRAWGLKVIDELSVQYRQIRLGSATEEVMRKEFNLTPSQFVPSSQVTGIGRLKVMKFLSYYVSRLFELTKLAFQSREVKWNTVTTFMEPGFGSETATGRYEDVLAWSEDVDIIDFDIYPYFYPESQKRRFAKVHYGFGFMRAVGKYYDKPMGFFVELDDRNYPIRINPVEATAEIAYTAVGQGADYLGTYIYRVFATLGGAARPERWDKAGQAFREIGEAGTLIAWTQRRPSKIGLYFPVTDWMLRGKKYYPTFAYELFQRSFGDCDLVHEEIAQDQGFGDINALILSDVKVLPIDIEERIIEFVREGGILIIDRIPAVSPEGKRLTRLKDMLEPLNNRDWVAKGFPYGDGFIFRPPTDNLDGTYRNAVENDDIELRDKIELWALEILESRSIYPTIKSDDLDVEANLKDGDGVSLLVLVNHNPETKNVKIELDDLKFQPLYAANAVTGEEIPFEKDGTLLAKVNGRWGELIALFPHKPQEPSVDAKFSDGYLVIEIHGDPDVALPIILDVIDPSGKRNIRYSRELILKGNEIIRTKLPINEREGTWRIQARSPVIKWTSGGSLELF